jgi:enoyl-CoA hydratase/carnithine racemase
MFENLRTLPKATIAILEGRAMGGGTEFLLACDMIFAAQGKAVLSLFEVALGGIPGATGTQRLPRVLGRARALEVILGCEDFDADLAERYGYINRAIEQAQLRPFVERLARRIASFPPRAVAVAKAAVDVAELPLHDGLREEMHSVDQILVGGEQQELMRALLAMGAQTESFERQGFSDLLEKLRVE